MAFAVTDTRSAFRLDATAEDVGISAADGTLIDGYAYGAQGPGVSQGRFPDGSTNIVKFPGTESPGDSNWRRLVDGMRQMGFATVVPDEFASPVVATFHNPDHPAFTFQALFEGMKQRGFIIFPGRLALADTFRIGCMGDVTEADMSEAMQAIADTLEEMGTIRLGRIEGAAQAVFPIAL